MDRRHRLDLAGHQAHEILDPVEADAPSRQFGERPSS